MLKPTLSLKISLLALLNVLLLGLTFLLFARLQFRFEVSSFLLGQARDRIVSVSSRLALQLPDTEPAAWNHLLAQYAERYPASFYLFDHHGGQLAGTPVILPPSFLELQNDPFAHDQHHGPPPSWQGGPPPKPPAQYEPRHGSMPDSPLALTRTSGPTRYWVGVRIPIWRAGAEPIHATLVWQIPSLWTEPFFFDFRPWLTVFLAIVLVSVACWLPLIRGITHTISLLTGATGQVANGHFEITMRVRRKDELGRLSESINQMAQRLSGLVQGQKRFLSDIAHELSSPLARMQLGLAIMEQRATENDSEYVLSVREEVEHMAELVRELLAFSKSRLGKQDVQLMPVVLHEAVQRAVARERNGAEISVSVAPDLVVLASPECLLRALGNILRNAVRYAGSSGPILLSAMGEGAEISISVADSGTGIPDDELEAVFRPFYRPEFARQRETGGTGLGLAIVRDCVESCGGTVRCRNRIPNGLEVLVRLHAAPPEVKPA